MKARGLGVPALLAALLAMPSSAPAATVKGIASAGPAAEEVILYNAERGERNRVRVLVQRDRIVITDAGARRLVVQRSPFANCRRGGARRLVCPNRVISFDLGDGNDTLSFAPGGDSGERRISDPLDLAEDYEDLQGGFAEDFDVDGGTGDDVITGSTGVDFIVPGSGRDRVEGRDGDDQIYLAPDGARDSIKGGGGVDGLYYTHFRPRTTVPVRVDLAAGEAGAAGERDRVAGIQRVHGGPKRDTLLGSGRADALYGEDGNDLVDGRAGSDLLVGDSPPTSAPSPNRIAGGSGDDLIDSRSKRLAPTTSIDCGPGTDTETGEIDDGLDPSCEAAAFRVPASFLPDEEPLFGVAMKVAPVARGADGAPTFEVPCPPSSDLSHTSCDGQVRLERPPVAGGAGPSEPLGSGSFSLVPGARGNVAVTLNPAGQAAIASGSPVAVHVIADLRRAAPSAPAKADFGWQAVLGT